MRQLESGMQSRFLQQVCGDGYRWTAGQAEEITTQTSIPLSYKEMTEKPKILTTGVWLVGELPDRPKRHATYDPVNDRNYATLFRQFADTEPTQEGILAFAQRFGMLGIGRHYLDDPNVFNPWLGSASNHEEHAEYYFSSLLKSRLRRGETVDQWHAEIADMRNALFLWDCLSTRNVEALAAAVVNFGENRWTFLFPDSGPDRGALPFLWEAPEGDLHVMEQCAAQWVMTTVNERLSRHVHPYLRPSEDWSDLSMGMAPTNLCGALWLQFAKAIDGNREYRRCVECGTWMEISPDTNRTNRGYCTDACRAKAYRGRKQETIQLHEQGVPWSEISERIGVDIRSVEHWVTEAQRKGAGNRRGLTE